MSIYELIQRWNEITLFSVLSELYKSQIKTCLHFALPGIWHYLGSSQCGSVAELCSPLPSESLLSSPSLCSPDTYINYLGSYSITQLSKMDSSQPLSSCHLLLNVTDKHLNLADCDVLFFIML